jgi:hypothetical protein
MQVGSTAARGLDRDAGRNGGHHVVRIAQRLRERAKGHRGCARARGEALGPAGLREQNVVGGDGGAARRQRRGERGRDLAETHESDAHRQWNLSGTRPRRAGGSILFSLQLPARQYTISRRFA